MNAYSTIYGSSIPLDQFDTLECETIAFLHATVLEAIQQKTRTQLIEYLDTFDFLLEQKLSKLSWIDYHINEATKERRSEIVKITRDLSDRLAIAAGTKETHGVTDPDAKPKEWTGQLEHSKYLFHIAKRKKRDAPLQFFLAKIRLADEEGSQFRHGLDELHQARGRELIGVFEATRTKEQDEFLSGVREGYEAEVDQLLIRTFSRAFAYGSDHAYENVINSAPLYNALEEDVWEDSSIVNIHEQIRPLLQNIVSQGIHFGGSGKRKGRI
ncbi:MAG TPA: hypothetical protein VHA78_02830 [Candidatus Peribacteraceae bacterium]|nr:hypothetical protein [Candidatus Peribacteraceae bacterium]